MKRAAIVITYAVVFWILLPLGLVRSGFALDSILDLPRAAWPGGPFVLIAGLLFVAWATFDLWRRGHGPPVSALPPPQLVATGAYGLVRHPIYLGFHLALIGLALWLGSAGCLIVSGPLFLVGWLLYARNEERALLRRFGSEYEIYRTQVGVFPRMPLYSIGQALIACGALPVELRQPADLPDGPLVLIANHRCYLDPAYLTRVTHRRIRFVATAEVFRNRWSAVVLRACGAVPLRRYRADLQAARTLLWLLQHDAVIGIFVEGERSPLGTYQGAPRHLARTLSRLGVPVVPVGISGDYDAGPRWADHLRRRPIVLRVGSPLTWGSCEPADVIDNALRSLIDDPIPPVHVTGLPREPLRRVLWACPRCGDELRWIAAAFLCLACGARWEPTADGLFQNKSGQRLALAELAAALFDDPVPDGVLECQATAFHETCTTSAIRALEYLGAGVLHVDSDGLVWGSLCLPMAQVHSVSTERADTLQVATATEMWQFRPATESVFRLRQFLARRLATEQPTTVCNTRQRQPSPIGTARGRSRVSSAY
jgi:1-acyl-sn-glycerol-3-phosphate acyltransferase